MIGNQPAEESQQAGFLLQFLRSKYQDIGGVYWN